METECHAPAVYENPSFSSRVFGVSPEPTGSTRRWPESVGLYAEGYWFFTTAPARGLTRPDPGATSVSPRSRRPGPYSVPGRHNPHWERGNRVSSSSPGIGVLRAAIAAVPLVWYHTGGTKLVGWKGTTWRTRNTWRYSRRMYLPGRSGGGPPPSIDGNIVAGSGQELPCDEGCPFTDGSLRSD